MRQRDVANLPVIFREAVVQATRAEEDQRTIDVLWTTGATVRRRSFSFWDDDVQEYDEELVVSDEAVRLDALNSGAPFLDSHSQFSLDDVIGRVEPGSAKLKGGKGYATVRLSRTPNHANVVQNIMDGIIQNVSVGYRIHKITEIQRKDKVLLRRVDDWEPLEISAVAIGADPKAKTIGARSEGERLAPCIIARAGQVMDAAKLRMRMRQRQYGFGG